MLPTCCAQFPHWKYVELWLWLKNSAIKLDVYIHCGILWLISMLERRIPLPCVLGKKERECSQESLLANRESQVQCTKPRKSGEQTKFMKTIIMIQKLFHKLLECGNTGVLQDVSTVSLSNCGLVLENGINYNLKTTLSQSKCEFREGRKVKICTYLNFPTRTSLSVVTSKWVKTFLPIFLIR